jgi:hypothetical protein
MTTSPENVLKISNSRCAERAVSDALIEASSIAEPRNIAASGLKHTADPGSTCR